MPDPNDVHVVAAALLGRADLIVTENVKDFPDSVLAPMGLEVIRTDAFLLDQFDLSPSGACRIVTEQAAAMSQPPVEIAQLLDRRARSVLWASRSGSPKR